MTQHEYTVFLCATAYSAEATRQAWGPPGGFLNFETLSGRLFIGDYWQNVSLIL